MSPNCCHSGTSEVGPHFKSRHGYYQSIMLPKPVSKASLSCQRSPTLAAPAGHQRQKKKKKTVLLFILAHLKPAMGLMHLKRCSGGMRKKKKQTLRIFILKQAKHTPKDSEVLSTHTHTHTHTHMHIYEARFPYLGLAAGKHWGGRSCSAHH